MASTSLVDSVSWQISQLSDLINNDMGDFGQLQVPSQPPQQDTSRAEQQPC